MRMNELGVAAPSASPEVFQQLGLITRQLHDTLHQLGVMPKLQQSAAGLSDARSRLGYVVRKTGEAADKVLNSVEQAKREQEEITAATRKLAHAIHADPARVCGSGDVVRYLADVEAATSRIDAHLTDIMLAQDFHDLTGQVVSKVVSLAIDLEDSLVKLLVQAAPAELAQYTAPLGLSGPVIDPDSRADVVAGQGEVDDLLASLGF